MGGNRGGGAVAYLEPLLEKMVAVLQRRVAVRDVPPDDVLRARDEVAREQLDELVLHILDEVKPRRAVLVHDEHRQVGRGVLDARVQHLDHDVRVLVEADH